MGNKKEKNAEIRGIDVVRVVSTLRAEGKIDEKLTADNYKKYTYIIGEEVHRLLLEQKEEDPKLVVPSKGECIERSAGLVRYLAVRNRL